MIEPDMDRVRKVVDEAQIAFWATVVEQYPEIKTGDMDPPEQIRFTIACEEAVKAWLIANYTEEEE